MKTRRGAKLLGYSQLPSVAGNTATRSAASRTGERRETFVHQAQAFFLHRMNESLGEGTRNAGQPITAKPQVKLCRMFAN